MKFDVNKSLEILDRTPAVLETMPSGPSEEWIRNNEGPATWCPYDILGHLIHGEKTDWIPQIELILSENEDKTFEPFGRFAQFEDSEGKTCRQLLNEFKKLRKRNTERLRSINLSQEDLMKKGMHLASVEVTLSQLLSAWTVHNLNHIAQISRVMAKQYKTEVGPWEEYVQSTWVFLILECPTQW